MMKRALFLLFFLLGALPFTAGAEEETVLPIIAEMGFLGAEAYDAAIPPQELELGVTMARGAFYKLSYKNTTIESGRFSKGTNRLAIFCGHLFGRSGSYDYLLEVKADTEGGRVLKYTITVGIERTPPAELSLEPLFVKRDPLKYELSMYIEGQLAARSRKAVHPVSLEKEMKAAQKALESGSHRMEIDPRDPSTKAPASMKLPIIPSLLMLYKLARGKKRRKIPPPTRRTLNVTFHEPDDLGIKKTVHARTTLRLRPAH